MCIKDWNIILDTVGKQLNLMALLTTISIILYVIADFFSKNAVGLCDALTLAIVKGVAVFLAAYYFIYCIILTKKIVDKYYK
jgi:uncharacterized membrane-anchored protein